MLEARADNMPSTAVLLERGGKFFFYEPGLAVIASDDSITGAYEKFLGARQNFIREVENAGLSASEAMMPGQPTGGVPSRSVAAELGLFLTKTFIVLVVVGGVGLVVVAGVKRSVTQLVASAGSVVQMLSGSQSALRDRADSLQKISLVDIVSKAAQHAQAMPDDRKELLRQSVGILSREAEPIIEAWRNPPENAAPSTPSPAGGK